MNRVQQGGRQTGGLKRARLDSFAFNLAMSARVLTFLLSIIIVGCFNHKNEDKNSHGYEHQMGLLTYDDHKEVCGHWMDKYSELHRKTLVSKEPKLIVALSLISGAFIS